MILKPCTPKDRTDPFERLVAAQLPTLRFMALRLCRDSDRAADLVQDTLERALTHRTRFTEGTQLEAWLRTIMRNLFLDGWRRASARCELLYNMEDEAPPPQQEPENQACWRLIDDDQLQEALARLPEILRTTFEIHTSEGLSYVALAKRLGVSPSTAGTRLLRARRRLRALLVAKLPRDTEEIRSSAAESRRWPGSQRGSRRPGYAPA